MIGVVLLSILLGVSFFLEAHFGKSVKKENNRRDYLLRIKNNKPFDYEKNI